MFWDDIKEIKSTLQFFQDKIIEISTELNTVKNLLMKEKCEEAAKTMRFQRIEQTVNDIEDKIDFNICSDEPENLFNQIHDKLRTLTQDEKRQEQVRLAIRTLDKFEDYMKNVDKLNAMINEFKGCVSMARAAFEESKKPRKVRTPKAKGTVKRKAMKETVEKIVNPSP